MCVWENLYGELHPGFLRSKKGSFLSTNFSLKKKALPTTFLPSVKTLTKNRDAKFPSFINVYLTNKSY